MELPADMHSALDDKLGLEVSECTADRVVGSIPVEGNTQPYGLLHGGATATLVETLGSLGSLMHGQPDKGAVGVDLNVTHLRSARSGRVTGTATPVHKGSTSAVWSVEVRDDEGRVTAVGRLTCRLLEA